MTRLTALSPGRPKRTQGDDLMEALPIAVPGLTGRSGCLALSERQSTRDNGYDAERDAKTPNDSGVAGQPWPVVQSEKRTMLRIEFHGEHRFHLAAKLLSRGKDL